MDINKYIANFLCIATREILLEKNKDWLIKKGNPKIKLLVGSGKRTYHIREAKGYHTIRYGKRMVENKKSSNLNNSRWLTSREIKDRGYYNGEITKNLEKKAPGFSHGG